MKNESYCLSEVMMRIEIRVAFPKYSNSDFNCRILRFPLLQILHLFKVAHLYKKTDFRDLVLALQNKTPIIKWGLYILCT